MGTFFLLPFKKAERGSKKNVPMLLAKKLKEEAKRTSPCFLFI